MSFYFSLFQIIDAVERLGKDMNHLTGRILRISPRDARANRELLEQCQDKLAEVEKVLHNKTHISKITLRKASLLYQVLGTSWSRVARLSAAAVSIESADEAQVKAIWTLLGNAQKQYQVLVKTLSEQTGVAPMFPLNVEVAGDYSEVLKREIADEADMLKCLDRAVEVFGEEQGLLDTLMVIRKELQDLKKKHRQFQNVAPTAAPVAAPAAGPAPKAAPAMRLAQAVNA